MLTVSQCCVNNTLFSNSPKAQERYRRQFYSRILWLRCFTIVSTLPLLCPINKFSITIGCNYGIWHTHGVDKKSGSCQGMKKSQKDGARRRLNPSRTGHSKVKERSGSDITGLLSYWSPALLQITEAVWQQQVLNTTACPGNTLYSPQLQTELQCPSMPSYSVFLPFQRWGHGPEGRLWSEGAHLHSWAFTGLETKGCSR